MDSVLNFRIVITRVSKTFISTDMSHKAHEANCYCDNARRRRHVYFYGGDIKIYLPNRAKTSVASPEWSEGSDQGGEIWDKIPENIWTEHRKAPIPKFPRQSRPVSKERFLNDASRRIFETREAKIVDPFRNIGRLLHSSPRMHRGSGDARGGREIVSGISDINRELLFASVF